MDKEERKEHIYAAIQDLHLELSCCIGRLTIINEFIRDLVNVKAGKEPTYETKQTLKLKKSKN